MDKHKAHDLLHAWNGGKAQFCQYCTGEMNDSEMMAAAKKLAVDNATPRTNPDLPYSQRMNYSEEEKTAKEKEEAEKAEKEKKKNFCEIETFVDIMSFSEEISKLPKVIKILPIGEFKTPQGTANITKENISEMVKHFGENLRAASSKIGLPVDFEHGRTALGRIAGAWMKNLFAKKDGLYAEMDYTELGKQKLESGEYKCFSPSFFLTGYVGPQDGKEYDNVVTGGAFCNTPVLTHALDPIVYSEDVKSSLLTDEKKSHTLVIEITKTQMNLSEIITKPKDQRSSDEQKFLVDHKKELTWAQAEAEGLLDIPYKKEVQLSEGQVAVDAKEFAELKENAAAGKSAAEELRRARLEKEVTELVFSDEGSKLPTDQINNAVDLLMEMSEPQATKYKEQLKNLPTPKQFTELGTDKQLDFTDNPGAQWNKLVNDRKKEKEISFSEAENQLQLEQPELFKQAYATKAA